MGDDAIVARIAGELGVGREVVDALAERLSPSQPGPCRRLAPLHVRADVGSGLSQAPVFSPHFSAWASRLLSNEKERILVSGMGLERVAKCWRPGV